MFRCQPLRKTRDQRRTFSSRNPIIWTWIILIYIFPVYMYMYIERFCPFVFLQSIDSFERLVVERKHILRPRRMVSPLIKHDCPRAFFPQWTASKQEIVCHSTIQAIATTLIFMGKNKYKFMNQASCTLAQLREAIVMEFGNSQARKNAYYVRHTRLFLFTNTWLRHPSESIQLYV